MAQVGKEPTINVGELGLIPGLGRSPEKGKSIHSSILAWRIPWTLYSPWGCKESDTAERLLLSFTFPNLNILEVFPNKISFRIQKPQIFRPED